MKRDLQFGILLLLAQATLIAPRFLPPLESAREPATSHHASSSDSDATASRTEEAKPEGRVSQPVSEAATSGALTDIVPDDYLAATASGVDSVESDDPIEAIEATEEVDAIDESEAPLLLGGDTFLVDDAEPALAVDEEEDDAPAFDLAFAMPGDAEDPDLSETDDDAEIAPFLASLPDVDALPAEVLVADSANSAETELEPETEGPAPLAEASEPEQATSLGAEPSDPIADPTDHAHSPEIRTPAPLPVMPATRESSDVSSVASTNDDQSETVAINVRSYEIRRTGPRTKRPIPARNDVKGRPGPVHPFFQRYLDRHEYFVRPGDTLAGIAYRLYGDEAKAATILARNRDQLTHADQLRPGALLKLP